MHPLSALLDNLVRRRFEHQADYAAFLAEHGGQDIAELTGEEIGELFSICLMEARLDAELETVQRLLGSMSQ